MERVSHYLVASDVSSSYGIHDEGAAASGIFF